MQRGILRLCRRINTRLNEKVYLSVALERQNYVALDGAFFANGVYLLVGAGLHVDPR